ncbi:MAG: PTS transporter subunit EIIC [Pisciglobus halotolerans]|nr:PTS transporter subunit EIIC [Pisciglobus halotolerans]
MKEKLQGFFKKLDPIFDKIGKNAYLKSISGAMMATLGPILIGSIFTVIPALAAETSSLSFLANYADFFAKMSAFTLDSMSLYIVILMPYHLVRNLDPKEDGISASIIALVSFLVLTPIGSIDAETSGLPLSWLGPEGVFTAMLVGLLSARLYLAIKHKGWKIKMPDGVPPMVTNTMESLIPTFLVVGLFIVVSALFSATSFGNLHNFIYSVVQVPLKGIGGSIGAFFLISIIQQIFWFFGIHGTSVINAVVQPLWMAMDVENLQAIQQGQTPPNIGGFAFFSIVTWTGTALGLVLLMLRAKSQQYRQMGKISIVPALFGVTEPVIYGTPLVLTFDLAFPFIMNNSIVMVIAYLLTRLGIVARFSGVQPIFGLPLGLNAAVQGSLSIILLQIVIQVIISPILWYPWFKRLDRKTYKREQEAETT